MPRLDRSAAPECTGGFRHPLEIIPVFRRIRPNFGRDVIYTVIWNSLFALFFTAVSVMIDPRASILETLRQTFVIAQCIGFVIYAGFFFTEKLFGRTIHRLGFWLRSAYYAGVTIVAIFPGYLIAFRILNWKHGAEWLFSPRAAISIIGVALVIVAILLMIFVPRERAARAEASMAREKARVAAAEKEATTARMKLLEAQVEPHFLYNTLAHVISLIDAEPRAAKRMIEGLIALLRASAASAGGGATLGVQVDLLRAYLEIVGLRMESRLTWRIDVPPSLRAIEVAPMLLQPVVENAVKHGIEPSVAGGEVSITGRSERGMLVMTVTDTGGGFRASAQPGIGLSNLRARLAAAYGDDARMTIEDVAPHGTRVTLVVPIMASKSTVDTSAEALVASQ